MKYLSVALIYVSFFIAIGICCYITKNPNVLWALFFMVALPSMNDKGSDNNKNEINKK